MKTSLEIIKELIQWFEKFSEENPDSKTDLSTFILWLNSKLFADEHTATSSQKHGDLDMELSFLLAMQYRHYKTYAKDALIDSDLSSLEGF